MLQDSVTWDVRAMIREPGPTLKVYILFLLVVWITASVKVVRVWLAAPPFRLSRQRGNPAYLAQLQTLSASLTQWIGCTFLACGIVVSAGLYDVRNRLLDEALNGKAVAKSIMLFYLGDFASVLSMAIWVALSLFLVRWHMLWRIEQLSK